MHLIDGDGFDRQVEHVQDLLKELDDYYERLTFQVDNIKQLMQSNENVVQKLEANEKDMKTLLDDDNWENEQNVDFMKRVKRIEKKLFVTVSLFNGLTTQKSSCQNAKNHNAKSKATDKLSRLGANLTAIGNELMSMRHDEAPTTPVSRCGYQRSCRGSKLSKFSLTQCKIPEQAKKKLDLCKSATDTMLQNCNELEFFSSPV